MNDNENVKLRNQMTHIHGFLLGLSSQFEQNARWAAEDSEKEKWEKAAADCRTMSDNIVRVLGS